MLLVIFFVNTTLQIYKFSLEIRQFGISYEFRIIMANRTLKDFTYFLLKPFHYFGLGRSES